MEPLTALLLIAAGAVAGTLNVLAGGGSFLTLPLLIFAGLPPGVANATNRVGILFQNVAAVQSFRSRKVLDLRDGLWSALPATLGSGVGAFLALQVSDFAFQRVLATMMIFFTLWTLWSPRLTKKGDTKDDTEEAQDRPWWIAPGFFLAGIYGGFIQAGVGFLVLAITSATGLDLVRGNAVKVLAVLCWTSAALLIFAIQGQVAWIPGLCLAAGMVVGGFAGARLTVLKGHLWVQRFVTVMVVVFAVKLWLGH